MLTNYVSMIPIKLKTIEEVIKAHFKECVYSVSRDSNHRGGEFTSKHFTWLAGKLGFIKVYTSPDTPTSNSVIDHTHSFLKASIKTY